MPSPPPTRADIIRFKRRSSAERLAGRHFSRAKRLNGGHANGYWSGRQWLELLAATDYRCHYCGRQLAPDELVPDHRRPLARAGKNCIANIVPACPQCNARKGSKTEDEFAAYLAAKEAA